MVAMVGRMSSASAARSESSLRRSWPRSRPRRRGAVDLSRDGSCVDLLSFCERGRPRDGDVSAGCTCLHLDERAVAFGLVGAELELRAGVAADGGAVEMNPRPAADTDCVRRRMRR